MFNCAYSTSNGQNGTISLNGTSTGSSSSGTSSNQSCILVSQSGRTTINNNNNSINLQCQIMFNAKLAGTELYAFIAVIVLIIIFFCLCPLCCVYYYCRHYRKNRGTYENSEEENRRNSVSTSKDNTNNKNYSNKNNNNDNTMPTTVPAKNYEGGNKLFGKKKSTYVSQEQEVEAQPMFNPNSDMYNNAMENHSSKKADNDIMV
jgi:hypothetical protein